MYVEPNVPTKKALKEAVANGDAVTVFSPGPFPAKPGRVSVEGPHYPKPHSWYATVETDENLKVTKVVG
jgi:hypothetical protein